MRNQRLFSTLYRIAVGVLAVSGLLQMPIAKRYYIASLPGFTWLGNFYVTHEIHYWTAALFLLLITYRTVTYFAQRPPRVPLRVMGHVRIVLLLLVVVTGILRVLKNRPEVYFEPAFIVFTDLAHLGSVVLFGLAVLVTVVSRRRAYWVQVP